MAELQYNTKIYGPVTLRSAIRDGHTVIEVWYNNDSIAEFDFSYFWDFIDSLLNEGKPTDLRAECLANGAARRYYQWMVGRIIANKLSPGPNGEEPEIIKEVWKLAGYEVPIQASGG